MGHYDRILKTRRRINGVPMTSVGDAAVLFTEYDEQREREQPSCTVVIKEDPTTIIADAIGDTINDVACIFAEKLSGALVSNISRNCEPEREVENVEYLPDGSRRITIIER